MLLRLNILAFVAGTSLLQLQAELPNLILVMWLLLPVIVIRLLGDNLSNIGAIVNSVLLLMVCLGLGFFWAAAFAHWRLADALPSAWEQRDIQVVGVVANLPYKTDRSVHFQLDVEHVITDGAIVPKRIALSWYKSYQSDMGGIPLPLVKAGERWRLIVRLKQPHGNANPHGFDYEAWALERNIRAVGYVRTSIDNQHLESMIHHPAYWVEYVREDIQQRFTQILTDQFYSGVLKALATGDQQAIPRDQWQVFVRTGTIHLMAISGLHITLVSSLVFVMVLDVALEFLSGVTYASAPCGSDCRIDGGFGLYVTIGFCNSGTANALYAGCSGCCVMESAFCFAINGIGLGFIRSCAIGSLGNYCSGILAVIRGNSHYHAVNGGADRKNELAARMAAYPMGDDTGIDSFIVGVVSAGIFSFTYCECRCHSNGQFFSGAVHIAGYNSIF